MTILNNPKKLTKEEAINNIMRSLINGKEYIQDDIKTSEKTAIQVIKVYVSDLVCDLEIKCINDMNFNFVFTLEDIQKISNDFLLML